MRAIAGRFAVDPPIGAVRPLGRGLINETYDLEAGGQHYVLQRINGLVFPRPEQIMANLQVLGAHLAEQSAIGLRIPALIATREGGNFVRDADECVWRLLELIQDATTLARIERKAQALAVGTALGRFHHLVESLPNERLGLALPGFHATPIYLDRLLDLVGRTASADRTPEVQRCIDFVLHRRPLAAALEDAQRDGRIPLRVTHGDPKLDNMLFSRDGDRVLAIIDLDTVQPGLLQHDIGDCLRSCCNRGGELTGEGDRIGFDLAICEAILVGYAQAAGQLLGRAEIELLYDAIRLMPFELGLRFLHDHLDGDRYFRVAVRGDNLRKAQIQFALVTDIERQAPQIRASIATCFSRGDLRKRSYP